MAAKGVLPTCGWHRASLQQTAARPVLVLGRWPGDTLEHAARSPDAEGDQSYGLSRASVTSGPKRSSDLFFNLKGAISHHTPPKYVVYFAKSALTKTIL